MLEQCDTDSKRPSNARVLKSGYRFRFVISVVSGRCVVVVSITNGEDECRQSGKRSLEKQIEKSCREKRGDHVCQDEFDLRWEGRDRPGLVDGTGSGASIPLTVPNSLRVCGKR